MTAPDPIKSAHTALTTALSQQKWNLPGASKKCVDAMKNLKAALEKNDQPINQSELEKVYQTLNESEKAFKSAVGIPIVKQIQNLASKILNKSSSGEWKTSWEIGKNLRNALLSKYAPIQQIQKEVILTYKTEILKKIKAIEKPGQPLPNGPTKLKAFLQNPAKNPLALSQKEIKSLSEVLPENFSKKQDIAIIHHCLKNQLFKELEAFTNDSSEHSVISTPEFKKFITIYLPLFQDIEILFKEDSDSNVDLQKTFETTKAKINEDNVSSLASANKELFPKSLGNFLRQFAACDRTKASDAEGRISSLDLAIRKLAPILKQSVLESKIVYEENSNTFNKGLIIDNVSNVLQNLETLGKNGIDILQEEQGSLEKELVHSSQKYSTFLLSAMKKNLALAKTSSLARYKDYTLKAANLFHKQSISSRRGINQKEQSKLFFKLLIQNSKNPSGETEQFDYCDYILEPEYRKKAAQHLVKHLFDLTQTADIQERLSKIIAFSDALSEAEKKDVAAKLTKHPNQSDLSDAIKTLDPSSGSTEVTTES